MIDCAVGLFVSSFIVSFITCLLCIKMSLKYKICVDIPVGIQKIHSKPVPRMAGLALLTGVVAGLLYLYITKNYLSAKYNLIFLICSLPIFAAGFWEDLTKKVSPRMRLTFATVSAIMAVFFLDLKISEIDIPVIDYIFSGFFLPGFFIVIIGIAGLVNAINIIDGINGLASGVSMIILSCIAFVAFDMKDFMVLNLALIMIGVTFAFFLWNYPGGFIFLGDSGAYFLGFGIAVLSIMLVNRNPEVSPWFPMALVVYPVWETLFSMWRRKRMRKKITNPDSLHLHSLLYKRVIRYIFNTKDINAKKIMISPLLWVVEIFLGLISVMFYSNTLVLVLLTFGFILAYTKIYFSVIRFKTTLK